MSYQDVFAILIAIFVVIGVVANKHWPFIVALVLWAAWGITLVLN